MLFDSFYISILSEEIKSGQKKMIKGAITGLISNLYATFKVSIPATCTLLNTKHLALFKATQPLVGQDVQNVEI